MNKKKAENYNPDYGNLDIEKRWPKLYELAHNAVIQVFAHVSPFNWIQPYRIESPFENRGSGFFVTKEGHFITNAHVVEEARRIWVHIPALGQMPLPAHVISICPEIDIAMACLSADALKLVMQQLGTIVHFEYGDSDTLKPTDSVVVLGYPLGQNHLKSSPGVISGREFSNGRPLLQITAPLNPGNSGGPLVNPDGKVVGIIVSGVLEAQGVGYAIPINELKTVLDPLLHGGLVRRPKLGMILGCANDEKAILLNNPQPAGLYVCNVIPDSLCDMAGVHAGDMLYELNGYPIDAYGESTVSWGFGRTAIYDILVNIKTGAEVRMVIYRNGQCIDISFAYELTPPAAIRRLHAGFEPIDYEIMGGLVLMPLTDDHRELLAESAPELISYQWQKSHRAGAVVITYVLPGSYAHQLYSLLPGDILSYVNDVHVTDLTTLRQALFKSITTGLISIRTETDSLAVLSLKKLLADEERLSTDFMYPVSQTVIQLQEALLSATL